MGELKKKWKRSFFYRHFCQKYQQEAQGSNFQVDAIQMGTLRGTSGTTVGPQTSQFQNRNHIIFKNAHLLDRRVSRDPSNLRHAVVVKVEVEEVSKEDPILPMN